MHGPETTTSGTLRPWWNDVKTFGNSPNGLPVIAYGPSLWGSTSMLQKLQAGTFDQKASNNFVLNLVRNQWIWTDNVHFDTLGGHLHSLTDIAKAST